jgi:hypothetical protein
LARGAFAVAVSGVFTTAAPFAAAVENTIAAILATSAAAMFPSPRADDRVPCLVLPRRLTCCIRARMRVGVNATFVVERLRIGDPGTMSVT